MISVNDVAYLPGLPLRVPRRFVEGAGFEPTAHLSSSGESPPLWSDAVALISVGGPHPLIPILPVCANYSGFYPPNMSILIVLCFR